MMRASWLSQKSQQRLLNLLSCRGHGFPGISCTAARHYELAFCRYFMGSISLWAFIVSDFMKITSHAMPYGLL